MVLIYLVIYFAYYCQSIITGIMGFCSSETKDKIGAEIIIIILMQGGNWKVLCKVWKWAGSLFWHL